MRRRVLSNINQAESKPATVGAELVEDLCCRLTARQQVGVMLLAVNSNFVLTLLHAIKE